MAADIILRDNGARSGDILLVSASSQVISVADVAVLVSSAFKPSLSFSWSTNPFDIQLRDNGAGFGNIEFGSAENQVITVSDVASLVSTALNSTLASSTTLSVADLVLITSTASTPVLSASTVLLLTDVASTTASILDPSLQYINPFDIYLRDNGTDFSIAFGAFNQSIDADVAVLVTSASNATAAAGAVTIALTDVASSTASAVDPTLSSSVVLSVSDIAITTATAFDPLLNRTLALADVAASTASALSPDFIAGSVTIELADLASTEVSAFDPYLNRTIYSDTAVTSASAFDPSIETGNQVLNLADVASTTAASLEPSINQTIVVADIALALSEIVNTTIVAGSLTLFAEPALASSTASTPLAHRTVPVDQASVTGAVLTPTITAGAVTINVSDTASLLSAALSPDLSFNQNTVLTPDGIPTLYTYILQASTGKIGFIVSTDISDYQDILEEFDLLEEDVLGGSDSVPGLIPNQTSTLAN